jgi:hypothetical protein
VVQVLEVWMRASDIRGVTEVPLQWGAEKARCSSFGQSQPDKSIGPSVKVNKMERHLRNDGWARDDTQG